MRIPHISALRASLNNARRTRLRITRVPLAALFLSAVVASTLAFSSISSAKLTNKLQARKASSSSRSAGLNKAAKSARPFKPTVLSPAPSDASLAMVTTDKTDYLPGEVVIISGSGWMAGEVVSLVLHNGTNGQDTALAATADEYGNILNKEFSTTEEHVGTTFTLAASGQSSGRNASATFTDGGSMNYSPNNHVLNIQSTASPNSASFVQTVSAPRGNGNFTASLLVTGTGGNPLPAAWVSAVPNPLSYSTGVGTPTVFFPQMRTVKVTVPAFTAAGTYTGQVRANPSTSGVGQGPGTNLSVVVTADNAPPNTLLSATTPPSNPYNGVDWTNQDVTVTLSATDTGTPASGVASTQYKLDSGPYVTYGGPFTISTEGITVITYFSTDNQGNAEPGQTFTVKIDKTAPAVTAVRDTPANANGWNNTDVDVSYTASDALSGINAGASDATPYTLIGEGAGQSHTFTVYDNAGNSATGTVNDINIDKTEPTVTASRTPAANGFGWNNTDVTVSVDTASDALSGIDTTSSPVVVSTEGAGQSAIVSATDKAGNIGSATVNDINIDKTAPTITAGRSPAANANGWNNTDVTVSVSSVSDALSGIDSSDSPVVVSTEGANQSVTLSATDKAGNSASATVNDINIDKTAPLVTAVRDTPANANGWNNTNVAVSYTASDALSGVDNATSDATPYTLTAEGNNQSHTFTVYDLAGNSSTVTVSDIRIDKTAPTISSSRAPLANANGWNNTDVVASYNASDALSGLDGSSPATGSHTFSAEAAGQSHTFSVTDLAGNSASSTVSGVNIDKTAPSISASRTPTANGFGWNNTDVTANYTASDALSGLDASSPATGSHLFNTEGANQSHTFSVTDQAGNSNSASVNNVNIDKTAPTVTITTPANGGSYVFNSIVAANFSTSDALSGLNTSTQTSTVPNGSNISTSPVGAKSFNVSVQDKAGNLASQTNNYSVVYAPVGAICPSGPGRTILPPINPDGSSVFKKGSTVPAKFRVYDANCNSIGTAGVVTDFRLIQVISGTLTQSVNEEVISTASDPAFRWSPTDQQWIFNINTKNLSANMTYVFQVSLNDGTSVLFRYGLK